MWRICRSAICCACSSSGLFWVRRAQDLHGAADGREGVAQLVGEQRQELVLQAVGLLELIDLAALAQVARDLGEAPQLSVLVVERRDHDVGPEPRAVLTNPPALVFDASVLDRGVERHCGLPRAMDFAGVEDGECLPNASSAV